MVRVSAVSYTNSIPFVYGLQHSSIHSQIELSLDIPSLCAEKLLQGKADIGLIPAAVLPQMKEGEILSDFCIGADGPVDTVMLYSQVPLAEIKQIWLDFQSRTSVQLVQVLCKEWWKISPEFLQATHGYEDRIEGNVAGVIIGDRCFNQVNKFPYSYDLSENWKLLTGLPFVFAVWYSRIPLDELVKKEFSEGLKFGLEKRGEALKELLNPNIPMETAFNYINNRISYDLDSSKRQGLDLFLSKL
ncbi:MAG: menaquinone biosynthesis protein [Bacteroidia bacterium]|nr:menaquinone biosynthesis protein [Bacteroidia bacterium]